MYNNIKKPSELNTANYHLFKQGVRPMWEDPANAVGGKWVLTIKNKTQLNQLWLYTCLAMIGETFSNDEVMGAVVSVRNKETRLSLWTRRLHTFDATMALGREFKEALGVREKIQFQPHNESLTRGRSYCGKNAIEAEV